MALWEQILYLVLAIFIIWLLFRFVKFNKESFSWEKMNKSLFTLGILALILIGFIALMIWGLKQGG